MASLLGDGAAGDRIITSYVLVRRLEGAPGLRLRGLAQRVASGELGAHIEPRACRRDRRPDRAAQRDERQAARLRRRAAQQRAALPQPVRERGRRHLPGRWPRTAAAREQGAAADRWGWGVPRTRKAWPRGAWCASNTTSTAGWPARWSATGCCSRCRCWSRRVTAATCGSNPACIWCWTARRASRAWPATSPRRLAEQEPTQHRDSPRGARHRAHGRAIPVQAARGSREPGEKPVPGDDEPRVPARRRMRSWPRSCCRWTARSARPSSTHPADARIGRTPAGADHRPAGRRQHRGRQADRCR